MLLNDSRFPFFKIFQVDPIVHKIEPTIILLLALEAKFNGMNIDTWHHLFVKIPKIYYHSF